MNLVVALALPLLTSCSGMDALLDAVAAKGGASPIVRASNDGSARMMIIVCPRTEAGIEAARELMQQLISSSSELVVGRSGGNATLIVNACPSGAPLLLPAPPVPTSTRRN